MGVCIDIYVVAEGTHDDIEKIRNIILDERYRPSYSTLQLDDYASEGTLRFYSVGNRNGGDCFEIMRRIHKILPRVRFYYAALGDCGLCFAHTNDANQKYFQHYFTYIDSAERWQLIIGRSLSELQNHLKDEGIEVDSDSAYVQYEVDSEENEIEPLSADLTLTNKHKIKRIKTRF